MKMLHRKFAENKSRSKHHPECKDCDQNQNKITHVLKTNQIINLKPLLRSTDQDHRKPKIWIKAIANEQKGRTSRDEERLGLMEVDATNRPIMLVKAVNKSAHSVVPELDHPAVQAGKDPWPLAMKAQPFHPITLRLKLRQHPSPSLPNPTTLRKRSSIRARIWEPDMEINIKMETKVWIQT